jgi:antitoxin HicB
VVISTVIPAKAEAVENGRDAFLTFVSALADMGQDVPAPSAAMNLAAPLPSGKFITRVPKSIHARLAERAKAEGVSLNTLVLSLISESLGKRDGLAGYVS